jgi:iron complex outermembrane receptor protein
VFSVGTLPKEYPVLSASEFRNYVDTYGDSTQKSLLGDANTDWQKQIFHNALTTDDNLSISGVWGKMPYRINGEYLNQDGILQTDNLQRTSVSLNISPHLLNNSLKIDINVHGAITNTRFANQGAIQSAITFDPTQPVYSPGNKFGGYWEWLTSDSTRNVLSNLNPVGLLQEQVNKSQVERSFGNIQFDYAVPALKGLHANLNLGYDAASGSGTVNIPAYAAQSYNNSSNLTYIAPADSGNLYSGTNNYYQQKYFNKLGEFYLSYNKDLPSIKSNINAVAGTGYYDNSTQNYNYASFGATKDTIPGTQPEYALAPTEYTMESYYARLIYTFDNKYVLSGSYRTDGSSRFGPSYRWGQFPGGAFTWKINQEDFLKNSTVLSTLNMRLSYGETGNQDGIGLYNYIPTYFLSQPGSLYPFGGNYYNLYTPNAYVANLKWETTDTYDGGFDYGFLKNRINGSMDYYYKKTFNLLANVSIPAGTNYANQVTTNVGSMNDQGVEFNINIIPIQSKDIDWEVGFNAAYNHFKITNLTLYPNPKFLGDLTGGISGGTGNTVQVDAVGYAPNEFYLYQQVYGPNGKPIEGLYVDQNRDGIINSNDLVKEESPYPSWTFGFSNNLTYKKWTLNFTYIITWHLTLQ